MERHTRPAQHIATSSPASMNTALLAEVWGTTCHRKLPRPSLRPLLMSTLLPEVRSPSALRTDNTVHRADHTIAKRPMLSTIPATSNISEQLRKRKSEGKSNE